MYLESGMPLNELTARGARKNSKIEHFTPCRQLYN